MLQKIRDMLMQVLPICPVMLDLAAPTIYTEVPATSRLWAEEVFGPVLVSATFADNTRRRLRLPMTVNMPWLRVLSALMRVQR